MKCYEAGPYEPNSWMSGYTSYRFYRLGDLYVTWSRGEGALCGGSIYAHRGDLYVTEWREICAEDLPSMVVDILRKSGSDVPHCRPTDLIYSTSGETPDPWRRALSLKAGRLLEQRGTATVSNFSGRRVKLVNLGVAGEARAEDLDEWGRRAVVRLVDGEVVTGYDRTEIDGELTATLEGDCPRQLLAARLLGPKWRQVLAHVDKAIGEDRIAGAIEVLRRSDSIEDVMRWLDKTPQGRPWCAFSTAGVYGAESSKRERLTDAWLVMHTGYDAWDRDTAELLDGAEAW